MGILADTQPRTQALPVLKTKTLFGSDHVAPRLLVLTNTVNARGMFNIDFFRI